MTKESFLELLVSAVDKGKIPKRLTNVLEKAEVDTDFLDEGTLPAFAAAVEFYTEDDDDEDEISSDSLEEAASTISNGEYTFFDYEGEGEVGAMYVAAQLGCDTDRIPEWLNSYFDFSQCEEDVLERTGGRITQFGFFSDLPEDEVFPCDNY